MAERVYFAFYKLKDIYISNAEKLKFAVLTFIFGITPIGGLYPFGWAFFISCDKNQPFMLLALLGCGIINKQFWSSLVLATGILAFKKLLNATKKRPLLKVTAAIFAAIFLCVIEMDSGMFNFAARLLCSMFLPLFTVLFGLHASQRKGNTAHTAGLTAYLFTIVLAIDTILPFSTPSRVVALLITLAAANEGGMLYGGFLGFVCGLACDSATGAMLGICGLTSGLLFAVSEYLALPIGCLAGLCAGLYFLGASKVPMLIFCFVFSVSLHIFLKGRIKLFSISNNMEQSTPKEAAPFPLSEAFFAISQSARIASGGENAAARAADDYASFSSLLTYAKENQELEERTDEKLSEAAAHMLYGAGIRADNVRIIGNRKKHLEAENVVIDALSLSSDSLSQLVSSITGARMRQPEFYIKNGKAALYMDSAPKYHIECSRTGVCKHGERISGDTTSFFTSKSGYFFALISDGMGSGKEAAISSHLASDFLEKLLSAGASKQTSLSLLNSYLSSRENEVFATVDLFEADLYTGKGIIVKAGAAPSFVIRGGKCKQLKSATAPAGIIREVRAEQLCFSLRHGDLLVMASDGLAGDGSESTNALALDYINPKKSTADIANFLIEDAVRRHGKQDDMSVCVIKVLSAA